MPTVTVYSLGGTWTSAPTFTYTSGVTLEERLNYTDNNGAHDNILDDMFGVGRTNQQGHTSDPTGDADAGTQAIGQPTLFGMNVNGWNVSTGTMFEFLGSDGNTVYGSHIVTNDGTNETGPIRSTAGFWVFSDPLRDGVVYSPFGGFNPNGSLNVCFTRGTFIKTQTGERPIEELTQGDMVLTMDHGYQPIRWIGSSKRPATGNMAPILIRKGALGNDRDLRVSPQHRMLLQGWQAELLFGEHEVLATAKSLVNDHSIIRVEGGEVEYFHLLFDIHEIIYAEGAPSESFQPGEQGWKALDEPTRNEILELFPELSDGDFSSYGASARFSLKHKEGQLLGQYMLQADGADEATLNA
ncbi:Hint domain-containing protein [Planktomarina temperata]|nr:Hint domain-containing protein [Planktomarina temperata]